MADRFHTPDPLAPGEYHLVGPEAHHLAVVRRFAPGDAVTLFNGDGFDHPATVVATGPKRVVVTVATPVDPRTERPYRLWVASAVPKGDRADYLIEKLTELGVTRLTPLVCERSVVIPKAATEAKFRRQVIEASKQSGRTRLMAIDATLAFDRLLAETLAEPNRYLLHTSSADRVPLPPNPAGNDRLIAVGPEGGFTDAEVAAARASGWTTATLGPRTARVETAALVAAALS